MRVDETAVNVDRINMEPTRLTAAETAARLGVKPASLYAYVSRGLLARVRDAHGSTFDPLEVEAFARTRRPSGRGRVPSGAGPAGLPLGVLDTDIAQIEDDVLYLRGRPAAVLALESDVEAVAAWLWGMTDAAELRRRAPVSTDVAVARGVVGALGSGATLVERAHAAVLAFAATDPLRRETSRDAVARTGARLLTGIPRAVGRRLSDAVGEDTDRGVPADAATHGWIALSGRAPTPAEHRAISAALVLSVDHDLAVSTLAARVAASARGSGYAVVTAALGAFDSPLHGSASRGAVELLELVTAGEAVDAALAAVLRGGARGVPGFGQPLYTGIDPRAAALLPLVADVDRTGDTMAAVETVAREVERRAGLQPNLDLALAALAVAGGLPVDAGALVFGLGRTVGWIAHALAEYGEEPLRLRPRGRYVGP